MKKIQQYIHDHYGLLVTRRQVVFCMIMVIFVVIFIAYFLMRDVMRPDMAEDPITPPTKNAPLFEKK